MAVLKIRLSIQVFGDKTFFSISLTHKLPHTIITEKYYLVHNLYYLRHVVILYCAESSDSLTANPLAATGALL